VKRPVFDGLNARISTSPVDDQAQRDCLGRAPRKVPGAPYPTAREKSCKPDQAIQHAARLLRVHQVCIDFAGMFSNAPLIAFGVIFVNITRKDVLLRANHGFALATAFLTGFFAFFLPFLPVSLVSTFFLVPSPSSGIRSFGPLNTSPDASRWLPLAVRVARQKDGLGCRGPAFLQSLDDGGLDGLTS